MEGHNELSDYSCTYPLATAMTVSTRPVFEKRDNTGLGPQTTPIVPAEVLKQPPFSFPPLTVSVGIFGTLCGPPTAPRAKKSSLHPLAHSPPQSHQRGTQSKWLETVGLPSSGDPYRLWRWKLREGIGSS